MGLIVRRHKVSSMNQPTYKTAGAVAEFNAT